MSDQYAVFGNPIEHSKSPAIHTLFAQQTSEDIRYDRQLVALDRFDEDVRHFFQEGGKGLNVTVPFKLEAFSLAHTLTERAQTAWAVNTLWLDHEGHLNGDNTDGVGLVDDITTNHGWAITAKRVLILGAGGAVRGVLQPLLAEGPSEVVIANRTASKAQELAEAFNAYGKISGSGYDQISGAFDLIINGTSASIGGELPPIPVTAIGANCACYDMMYGAAPTVFLAWAREHGCERLADGLGMLVGQAAESFAIWRGVKPEIAPVIAAVRSQLGG